MSYALVPVRASTSRVCSPRASNWMCGTLVASARLGLTGETTLRTQMFWWALWTLVPSLTQRYDHWLDKLGYDLTILDSASAGTSHSVPQLSCFVPVPFAQSLSQKNHFMLDSACSEVPLETIYQFNPSHSTLNSTDSYNHKLVDYDVKEWLSRSTVCVDRSERWQNEITNAILLIEKHHLWPVDTFMLYFMTAKYFGVVDRSSQRTFSFLATLYSSVSLVLENSWILHILRHLL